MSKFAAGKEMAPASPGARVGGLPLVPKGTAWPICKSCGGPMQFEGQWPLDAIGRRGRVLVVFMCQNNPGMCEEYFPSSGGNSAFIVDASSSVPLAAPGLTPEQLSKFGEVRTILSPARSVVNAVGGEPEWIQADDTPTCDCGKKMILLLQLSEEVHEGLNFGGGEAYAFGCQSCPNQAMFLWQQ